MPPIFLGLVPAESRKVKPIPQDLLALVPAPTDNNTTLKSFTPDVERDTMPVIIEKAKRTRWQTRRLAERLKGSSIEETLRNDSNFILNYIRYTKDDADHEQIRSPRRLIHEGQGDCDCFAVTLATLLLNQGINFRFRIAQYPSSGGEWSHIYLVVPKNQRSSASLSKRQDYTVLDPVTNLHDHEVAFSRKRDYTMSLQYLDGFTPSRRLGECPAKETASAATAADGSSAQRPAPISFLSQGVLEATERKPTVDLLEAMDVPYQYNIDQNNNPMVMLSDPRFIQQGFSELPTVIDDTTAGLLTTIASQPLPESATPPGEPVQSDSKMVGMILGTAAVGGLLLWAFSGSAKPKGGQLGGHKTRQKRLPVLHI